MIEEKCTGCGYIKTAKEKQGWWSCRGYYGFSGYFCSKCYSMISHDPYGKPHDPEGYLAMVLKLGVHA